MANLKDTIVLGNLTVTGKVVASDILTNGTGSTFDTINVNNIYVNTADAIEFQDSVITNCSLSAPGGVYVNYIENLDGDLEMTSGNALNFSAAEYCAINADSIGLTSTNDVCFQSATGNQLILRGNDLIPGSNKTMTSGTSNCRWNYGYFDTVDALTKVYTPSVQNSGGIDINCGGSISLSASSAGGGYIDLKAKYAIRPNISIIPSVTTADLGSSGTPFNNVYGKNFYASSDIRLKENIVQSYFDYYSIINKIQLVNYTWKSDEQHTLHHGLIAQQLKEILPEELHNHLISESVEEKMMSVNDGKLVYFALGALQQQSQINNKLEQRLQKLEELIRGDK